MSDQAGFVEHLLDLMQPLGEVSSRKMFGGWGVFSEQGMFALVTRDGVFHLRADEHNRAAFEERELPQFMRMPYFQAPEECLDDGDALCRWAAGSLLSAARASAKKKGAGKSKKGPAVNKSSSRKKATVKKAPAKKVSAKKAAKKARGKKRAPSK